MLNDFQLLAVSGIYLGCVFSLFFLQLSGEKGRSRGTQNFLQKKQLKFSYSHKFLGTRLLNSISSISIYGEIPNRNVRADHTRINPVFLNTKDRERRRSAPVL